MRNCKVGSGGGRVTLDGGSLALKVEWPGSEPTFSHINSLVIFASPTRDKLTHMEHTQMLQLAKTTSKLAVKLSIMVVVDVSGFLIFEKAAIIDISK